jgi:uncharacterized protein YjdB
MIKHLTLMFWALLLSIASFAVGPITGPHTVCIGSTILLHDTTAGGLWSSSTPAIATIDSIGIVTGITSGVTTITYYMGGLYSLYSVTVNPMPGVITGPATVAIAATITLTDITPGGTWSAGCPYLSINPTSGLVTGISAGVCTVTYTLSTGCFRTRTITVAGGTPPGPIMGLNHVCIGSATTLTDSVGGGIWSSSNSSVATVGSGTGTVFGISAGSCTITYAVGTSIATMLFTVNPLPASITGPASLFVGSSITLSDATTGGIWMSGTPGIATITSGGIVTGVSPGTTNIYYQIATGCAVMRSISVLTDSTGTVLPISGLNHVCVSSTILLSDATTGGTWSSSNPSIASISSGGLVTGVSAGTCTITYTHGTSFATMPFTVYALPASIAGLTTVPVGSTVVLTDGTSGGVWSSTNPAVATVTSGGYVTGVSADTVTIFYTLPSGCFTSILVYVTGAFVFPITGVTHACTGATSHLYDSTAGGTWTSSNLSVATVNATTGIVTGIAPGTCTITYTVGTSFTTTTFVVYPLPSPISGPISVGAGGVITLTDPTSGGVWTSGNVSIATVSSTGVVTGVSAGTVNIYYQLSTGCAVSYTITVTGTLTLPITGTASACLGGISTLHDSTAGGTWSSSNTSIATVNATSGVVTGVSVGICTISYTHGSSIATRSFTVNPLPAVPSGPGTVSTGGTITLTDASPGGSWFSGNTGIATVGTYTGITTGMSAGTVWIYYALPTGCTNYKSVTVTAGTSIWPITGTTHTCAGSLSALHDSTAGGTWSSSNTSIATVGATTGNVTGISAGTCTISYTVGTSTVTTSFTVYALPAVIGGPVTVAVGGTITLTNATSGGAWSSSSTARATVNATTGLVTGVSAGTVTIYYTLTTGCSKAVSITVTGGTGVLPIYGTLYACLGSSSTLHDSTTGGSWSSSNTAIAIVGSLSGVVTGMSVGSCTITYTVGTSIRTAIFIVYPIPAAITGPSTVIAGGTITLSETTTGGSWISGNTTRATVNATTGVVTGVSAGTVNIYYTTTGGCGVYRAITVTGTSMLPITGTFHTCVGTTTTLHDSTSGGTWSSSNTTIATVGVTSGVVTGISAGTCVITYTSGSSVTTATFVVYALPAAIGGPSTVSVGGSITMTDASVGGTWISGNSSIATVNATTGVVTGVTSGVVNIYYQLTTGCGAYRSVTVTGGGTSVLPVFGSTHTCVGSTSTLFDSTSGGTWSSSNTVIATVGITSGVVTGISAGTCTITYALGTSVATVSFTVYALPAAIIGTSTMCAGTSITLSDATTGGTWLSGNTSIATTGSLSGVVAGVTAGTVNIYYQLPTGCGASKTITVTAAPAPISGTGALCIGTATTLTDATPGGTWMSTYAAVATAGATTGLITGMSSGVTTIKYTVGGCGVSKVVTVNAAPAPISGASSVCAGTTITLTDATPGGAWTGSTPSIATVSTSGIVSGLTTGSVNIYYTVGGCSAYKVVVVNAVPGTIAGSSIVHTGGSPITLTNSVPGGTWFSGNVSIASTTPLSGIVTGVSGGTVNIYYSIGGCAVYKTITVISPAPPAHIGVYDNTDKGAAINADENTAQSLTDNTTTDVNSLAVTGVVRLYPNPTTGSLNIQWSNQTNGTASISIVDITGREVFKSEVVIDQSSGTSQINLGNLKDGMYMITIQSTGNTSTNRLVIQH